MNSFEKFINSSAFFPVLILLLVALIGALVWVIVSGKNSDKKNRQLRKNKEIDETMQIKIISQNGEERELNHERTEEDLIEENTSNEIKMVVELNSDDIPKEKVNIKDELKDVVYENEDSFVEEQSTTIEPVIDSEEEKKEEVPPVMEDVPKIEIIIPEITDDSIEIEEKELIDEGESFEIPNRMPLDETNSEEKSISIEAPNVVGFVDEGESIEVPHKELEDEGESIEIPIQKGIVKEDINDVFAVNPTGDLSINENVKIEMPNEYVGEKTEIFEFPDFNTELENSTEDIEQEIIDVAKKYVESIMKR